MSTPEALDQLMEHVADIGADPFSATWDDLFREVTADYHDRNITTNECLVIIEFHPCPRLDPGVCWDDRDPAQTVRNMALECARDYIRKQIKAKA